MLLAEVAAHKAAVVAALADEPEPGAWPGAAPTEGAAADGERRRWTADLRPDLGAAGGLWERVLRLAHDLDSIPPDGLFGLLHGVRCVGARLVAEESGLCLVQAPGEALDAPKLAHAVDLLPAALTKVDVTTRPLCSNPNHGASDRLADGRWRCGVWHPLAP